MTLASNGIVVLCYRDHPIPEKPNRLAVDLLLTESHYLWLQYTGVRTSGVTLELLLFVMVRSCRSGGS